MTTSVDGRKNIDAAPNGRYNRFGEYVEPDTRCNCDCHIPGRNVLHCIPCCNPEPKLNGLDDLEIKLDIANSKGVE